MTSALFRACDKSMTLPGSAWVVLIAVCGGLGTALIAQYMFGYDPCVLCLWQRVPYVLGFVLGVLALLSLSHGRGQALLFLALCAPVFLAGAATAFFHTGVERHWWLGTEGCAIQPLHGPATLSLRDQLLATPTAHCDQISWVFLGLSMANWNLIFSLGLTGFVIAAVMRDLQINGKRAASK